MMNGIINVYKEKGFTSHDVVAKLRGILHQKKIGHTGTLDPDAVGVLPVCLGKATKVCDLLTDKDKEYEAVLLLGVETDTQDITGTVKAQKEITVSPQEVTEVIQSFIGDYDQIPPMYSALKVNGQKLCDLARAGVEVERKARRVQIHNITIEEVELPRVKMLVHCSKGTYIRTLCQDIGEKLGCGGCMESLVRTRVADFKLEHAVTLSQIEKIVQEERMEEILLPIQQVFTQYEKVVVQKQFNKLLYNGNRLSREWLAGDVTLQGKQMVQVYDEEEQFIGVYEYDKRRDDIKPVKIFME